MKIVIRKSTDTETGISVVKSDGLIETFNVVGTKIHTVESTYSQYGILTYRWFGDTFDVEIKEILGGHALDAFVESKSSKLLIDASQWTTSWDGVNDWVRDHLMPRLQDVGLRRLAVFVNSEPVEDANKFAVERFESQHQNVNGSFRSEQSAVAWLKAHD